MITHDTISWQQEGERSPKGASYSNWTLPDSRLRLITDPAEVRLRSQQLL
jgi:hypothetical protein